MKAERRPSAVITASIHADKKLGGARFAVLSDFAPILIKFILALCGCIGSAMTFLSCLNPGMSLSLTAAAVTVLCLVFTFIFSLKEKLFRIVSLLAAAALIIGTYIFRYEICAGFASYLNIFFSTIREEYHSRPFIQIIEPELAEYHIRAFSLFADCVMCAFACHSTVRSNSASGVCIATCMPVFAVLVYGLEPNLAAFFAVVVCWTAMFALESNAAEAISDPRCKKYSSYCGFCTAVIAALCIAALPGVSKKLGYERPEKLNIMYDEAVEYISGGGVQQIIDEIVIVATRNVAPTGAINHGKLGEFDEISFDGKTVLEVTIPKSDETVYLRGFVGSVYTGRSWEQLPAAKQRQLDGITEAFSTEGLSPLLLDGYNLKYTRTEIPRYNFSVKNVAANTNYLYMPYNLVPESVSRYKKNSNGFGGSSKSYIGQFYDPGDYYGYQNIFRMKWSTPTVLSEDEAAYRSFVYANYLDIPESFSPAEIFDESYYSYITAEEIKTGKSTLDEMTVLSRKLYFIKKWLRDNCEYSLTAGKLPAGKDFVRHFLDTREGSCSHFATTAVMMCRYAGIPARYAEGYVIKPADFPRGTAVGTSASVSVSDLRGHAWAEIYLDGFGWYPVEFTSGYGNVRTAIPTETTVSEPETETESETELSESTEETQPDETGEEVAPSPNEAAQTTAVTVTAVPETSVQETEAAETTVTQKPAPQPPVSTEDNRRPTVGFAVFGIKGEEKVDVLYDLTWLVILAAVVIIVPAAFILRRNAAAAKRRRTALNSARAAAIDDYRRFGKLLRLMELPEQGDMDFGEYAKFLSERSEMLADGTAEFIIGCALKASFGGESLTRNEANEMRLAVNSLAKRFCAKLSRFGKFRLKFIYCIL